MLPSVLLPFPHLHVPRSHPCRRSFPLRSISCFCALQHKRPCLNTTYRAGRKVHSRHSLGSFLLHTSPPPLSTSAVSCHISLPRSPHHHSHVLVSSRLCLESYLISRLPGHPPASWLLCRSTLIACPYPRPSPRCTAAPLLEPLRLILFASLFLFLFAVRVSEFCTSSRPCLSISSYLRLIFSSQSNPGDALATSPVKRRKNSSENDRRSTSKRTKTWAASNSNLRICGSTRRTTVHNITLPACIM